MRSYVEHGEAGEMRKGEAVNGGSATDGRGAALRCERAIQRKRRVKNGTGPLSSLCCVWLRLGCPLGNLPDSTHTAELVETGFRSYSPAAPERSHSDKLMAGAVARGTGSIVDGCFERMNGTVFITVDLFGPSAPVHVFFAVLLSSRCSLA
jgi:hypothetical protein